MPELNDEQRRQLAAAIDRAGRRLIALIEPEFPKTLHRETPELRIARLGLVARATGTMQSVLHQAALGLGADLLVVSRTLYDHAVALAWIAADPEERFARARLRSSISSWSVRRALSMR